MLPQSEELEEHEEHNSSCHLSSVIRIGGLSSSSKPIQSPFSPVYLHTPDLEQLSSALSELINGGRHSTAGDACRLDPAACQPLQSVDREV